MKEEYQNSQKHKMVITWDSWMSAISVPFVAYFSWKKKWVKILNLKN